MLYARPFSAYMKLPHYILYPARRYDPSVVKRNLVLSCAPKSTPYTLPLTGSPIQQHSERSPNFSIPVCVNRTNALQFHTHGNQSQQKKDPDETKLKGSGTGSDIDSYRKLSLFQKFKTMYRDYWYVLVPVHLSTSIVFLGIFYYTASSGVDIVAILEKCSVNETIIYPFRDSSAGYIAITYALYKIFTPIRYTVTLGGTTWAIKFLKTRGLIKPRPMKDAKENVQNIITAMKMPENQRQKFLEEKGMPRIGKAVSKTSRVTGSDEK